ncbi:Virulence factor MVIN-like protein, partial [mine drainage metagenome]
SSVAQINLLLDTVIASFLFVGSQTWLALSDRLMEFPLGVFGVALGTVILPTLARHHLSTDRAGFQRALDWGLRTALLIALPATVALVLLAKPMIATLFQHGRYNAFDTDMATLSLTTLSCGLPAFALVKVLAAGVLRAPGHQDPGARGDRGDGGEHGAECDPGGRAGVGLAAPELHRGGVLETLAHTPGLHMALGMASALAGYLNLTQLWLALHRQGVYQAQPGWLRHLGRTLLACAVMAAVLLLGRLLLWPDWTTPPALVRLWRLLALLTAGGLAYLAVLFALGFRWRELHEA